MNKIRRKLSTIGRVLAALALALGLAVSGAASAADDAPLGRKPPPREAVTPKLHMADGTLSRAAVRTVGEPRPKTATAPVVDEFDALPLGGVSRQESPGIRRLGGIATMVAHDCGLAENGDPSAAYRLGRRYLFGMGVNRDKRMGVAWMRAAASRGYGPAIQVASLVPSAIGRLRPWCRTDVAPPHAPSPPPAEIVKLVNQTAPALGVDPQLVLAVIQVESAYHTNALSPKEAAGLMQLIPGTAERFGVHNAFDPADNIRGGVKYLRWLLAYFEGNVTLALAGYNAGEHAVDRHGGVPPYAETQAYVRLVHRLYPQTSHRFDPGVTEPSARFARQTADAGR